jgi:hypothetical protein
MEVDMVSTNENDANQANAICLKSSEYSMSSERTFNYWEEPLWEGRIIEIISK